MAKVRREHKDKLLETGQWREFTDYKSALVLEGMPAIQANRLAVEKFLGAEAAENPSESGRRTHRDFKARLAAEGEPCEAEPTDRKFSFEIMAAEEEAKKMNKIPNTDSSVVSSVPNPPPPVKLELFRDKPQVGEVENITWVADHLRVVDVNPKDCPSLRAWNLLCECRENAYFRANFWKDHYGKVIPAKSQLENGKKQGGLDGQATMDMIDRIKAISDKAKGIDNGEGTEKTEVDGAGVGQAGSVEA